MTPKVRLEKATIGQGSSIKSAIKKINENTLQILLVADDSRRLLGTLSDGDIRRAILDGKDLNAPVNEIMNQNPKFLYEGQRDMAREVMLEHCITQVPIVDVDRKIIDLMLWRNLDEQQGLDVSAPKDNIVFIMAGGKGTRLDPFTKIIPKPLIPIADKPIIEHIMQRFMRYGLNDFIFSLNYKAEMIQLYFNEFCENNDYNISYVKEREFLGTAGSLSLIRDKIEKSVIVSNCDVVLDINFEDLLDYHGSRGNDITVVGAINHVKIPYGILKMENGLLLDIVEKPEYDFLVNAGIYILEPEVVSLVKDGEYLDMPTLIKNAKEASFSVGIYPVSCNWIDIGQWDEYKKAVEHFNKANIIKPTAPF